MRSLDHCPNCKREFYAHAQDAYCEECWRAWCKNDGTFEERTKSWASLIETPSPKNGAAVPLVDRLAEEIRRVDGSNTMGAGALAEALIPFITTAFKAYVGETNTRGTGDR